MRLSAAVIAMIALLCAAPVVAGAEVPAVGNSAPEFSLMSQENQSIGLKDYRGKWVVLYFYPKDFTQGCTIEAHNFQRDIESYNKAKAVILGVSFDSTDSHKDFCAKEGLTFKLLSDTGGAVSNLYGSVMEMRGNKLSARNTFIVDPTGKVARVFTGVQPAKHSEEVLAALADLQK